MSAKFTPAWIHERRESVAALTDELMRWALVREKVLMKLDVKAALAARALITELEQAAAELPSDEDAHESLALSLVDSKLTRLEDAARAMLGLESERPPSSPAAPRTAIRLRGGSGASDRAKTGERGSRGDE